MGNTNLLERKTHGMPLPTWVWMMTREGQLNNGLGSRSAWVEMAIVNQAKREKFYDAYKNKVEEIIYKGTGRPLQTGL